jgi:hypothetical protein
VKHYLTIWQRKIDKKKNEIDEFYCKNQSSELQFLVNFGESNIGESSQAPQQIHPQAL